MQHSYIHTGTYTQCIQLRIHITSFSTALHFFFQQKMPAEYFTDELLQKYVFIVDLQNIRNT